MRVRAKNQWGQTLDPQRADLWQLDMKEAIQGLLEIGAQSPYSPLSITFGLVNSFQEGYIRALTENVFFYAKSVTFPSLSVTSQPVMRDSRPYAMPDYDEPLGSVSVVFYHDIGRTVRDDIRQSELYLLLDHWRKVVRAGRGPMSTESVYSLRSDFKLPKFRFDLIARFLTGLHFTDQTGVQPSDMQEVTRDILQDQSQQNDALEVGAVYALKNAWLSSFQLGTVDHDSRGVHTITATFYAEDVLPL